MQLRAISTRRLWDNMLHRPTRHQEATLHLGPTATLHQEVTHHHTAPHLQATMAHHRQDTHHQVTHRRVLHPLATRHRAIHRQEVELRQAILQRKALMEPHQLVDHLTARHPGTTLHRAIMGLQVEAPTHRQRKIRMHVPRKIHMADLRLTLRIQVALLAVHHLAPHQEEMTTTGTALVVMGGTDFHLQATTTGSSHAVTPMPNLRRATHRVRIHITMHMGHLLSILQVAIRMVVPLVEPLIAAIAHIEVARRLQRIQARVRS